MDDHPKGRTDEREGVKLGAGRGRERETRVSREAHKSPPQSSPQSQGFIESIFRKEGQPKERE